VRRPSRRNAAETPGSYTVDDQPGPNVPSATARLNSDAETAIVAMVSRRISFGSPPSHRGEGWLAVRPEAR